VMHANLLDPHLMSKLLSAASEQLWSLSGS